MEDGRRRRRMPEEDMRREIGLGGESVATKSRKKDFRIQRLMQQFIKRHSGNSVPEMPGYRRCWGCHGRIKTPENEDVSVSHA